MTGGVAYGNIDSRIRNGAESWRVDEPSLGWTVGAGLDVGFTDYLSGRIEYLYVDLGETGDTGPQDFSASADFSVIRAGLNYMF